MRFMVLFKYYKIKISDQKQVIKDLSEWTDDTKLIEKAVSKIISRVAEEISRLERVSSYTNYQKLVEIRMGKEAWDKLSPESQKCLVSAKFLFSENILLGEAIDYSSVCLLASKAIEIELAKRLFVGYITFVKKQKGPDLTEWPEVLVRKDRDGILIELGENDFSLGSCAYIMGILPKRTNTISENKKLFNYNFPNR